MKGLAFVKDPDGYWIEVLSSEGLSNLVLGNVKSPTLLRVCLSSTEQTD